MSNHVACLLFFVFLRRLVVPRTEHRCEGTPLFFSAPGGRGLCVDRARKNGRDGMGICNLINHGWTRIWFANAHRYCVMACAVMLGGLAIAAESISITATPRYPWNGKVDLKFTIDGTSGTKYDTSFTAKDVTGGTNLTMKTLYKSNGTAANAAKEQLLPGTYNWVWDATADLTTRWPSYASCVPTSSAVLLKDAQLAAIAEFFAVPCGNAVADKSNRAKGRWIKTDGTGKSVQFAFSDDKYTKCVCVHFEQSGANVVGHVKWARYVTGLGRENEDFEANSATTQTIATSTTTDGYGLCKLEARIPQPDASVVLDRVVVEGKTDAPPNIKTATYMVIDLSGGSSAKSYPVSYLGAVPSGGWSDEYKKTKLVLRHCEAGSYNMLGKYSVKLTKSFYIGIFEVTQGQYKQITGGNPSYYKGDKRPVEMLSFEDVVGSSYGFGDGWPKSSNVGSSTCLGKLRSRTGLKFFLPTEAQWEYACRAGTTSSYNNGGSSSSDKLKVGRCYSNQSDGKGGYSSRHTSVGSYLANSWGIYDMHGNVYEWCLDIDNGKAPTGGTDPKGPTSPGYSWYRVLRGGDWGEGNSVTSNSRTIEYPAYENIAAYDNSEGYGFRICLTLE